MWRTKYDGLPRLSIKAKDFLESDENQLGIVRWNGSPECVGFLWSLGPRKGSLEQKIMRTAIFDMAKLVKSSIAYVRCIIYTFLI